ncbi:uncharacterized protein [Chironomus tepperi]|uniref:uncharacterized protein n=1 Tax=Chironomus tepperi TaxID=113505 RepID=UPI00391F8F08
MIVITFEIIFIGVFMLLNLLQTLLLTIFIVRMRKHMKKANNDIKISKNHNSVMLETEFKSQEKQNMYSGHGIKSNNDAEMTQIIYEEVKKVDNGNIDTYDHVTNGSAVYDKLMHMGVCSQKHNDDYEIVK